LFGCHVGKAVKLETREDQNMRWHFMLGFLQNSCEISLPIWI
jgi:hypothetical protein